MKLIQCKRITFQVDLFILLVYIGHMSKGAYEAGDVVTLDCVEFHYVYELIGDDGTPFYVGVTKDPLGRFKQHARVRSDRAAIGFPHDAARAQHIATQKHPVMRICSRHDSRLDAETAEGERISRDDSVMNCCNRSKRGHTFASGAPRPAHTPPFPPNTLTLKKAPGPVRVQGLEQGSDNATCSSRV